MHRTHFRASALVLLLTLAAACRPATAPAPNPPPQPAAPAFRLSNAAPSIDALVDEFLTALAAQDWNALEGLRVTESEYREFILPGSVAPGVAPKNYPATPSQYYWNTMNTKSLYSLRSLLASHGGRHYQRTAIAYAKGTQEYAWYRAYKKLRLTLADEQGQEVELTTGSIAEVNGQYKFVSFVLG